MYLNKLSFYFSMICYCRWYTTNQMYSLIKHFSTSNQHHLILCTVSPSMRHLKISERMRRFRMLSKSAFSIAKQMWNYIGLTQTQVIDLYTLSWRGQGSSTFVWSKFSYTLFLVDELLFIVWNCIVPNQSNFISKYGKYIHFHNCTIVITRKLCTYIYAHWPLLY